MKKIMFEMERETKNTVRFAEVVGTMDTATATIGTLYVQKHALKEINYKEGQKLIVTLEVDTYE